MNYISERDMARRNERIDELERQLAAANERADAAERQRDEQIADKHRILNEYQERLAVAERGAAGIREALESALKCAKFFAVAGQWMQDGILPEFPLPSNVAIEDIPVVKRSTAALADPTGKSVADELAEYRKLKQRIESLQPGSIDDFFLTEGKLAAMEQWAGEAKDLLAKVAVVVGYQSPGKPSSLQIEAARVLAAYPVKGGA